MKLKRRVEVSLEVEVTIDTDLDPVNEQESIRDIVEGNLKFLKDSEMPESGWFVCEDGFSIEDIKVCDEIISIGDITSV